MNKRSRWVLTLILVCAVSLTSGCETLRKKFIRKKKGAVEDVQTNAVLDPIDYPVKVKTASQVYEEHYSLWKVWQSELENIIDENVSDKKIQYTLEQLKEQLKEMQKLMTEPSQKEFDAYLQEVGRITAQYDKEVEFRNKNAIESQIHSLGRNIRSLYSPSKVKDRLAAL